MTRILETVRHRSEAATARMRGTSQELIEIAVAGVARAELVVAALYEQAG